MADPILDIINRTGETDINKIIAELVKSDSALATEFNNKITNLINSIGNVSIKNTEIDVAEFMGQTRSEAKKNRDRFKKAQENIAENLEDIAESTNVKVKGTTLNVSDLFDIDQSVSKRTAKKFDKTQRLILDNINGQLKNEQTNVKLKGSMFSLGKLFDIDPKLSLLTKMKFAKTQRRVLSAISNNAKYINFKFHKLSLDDFFGVTPKMGLVSKTLFKGARLGLMDKVFKAVDEADFSFSDEPITLDMFFGITPKMGLVSKTLFKAARLTLLAKIIANASKANFSFDDAGNALKGLGGGAGGGDRTFFDKETVVTVGEFSTDAIKQLSNLELAAGEGKGKKEDEEEKQSWFEKLKEKLPFIFGALGIAALVTGFTGMFDSGPFKGVKKLLIKAAPKLLPKKLAKGLKAFTGFIDDLLEPLLKKTIGGILGKTGIKKLLKSLGRTAMGKSFRIAKIAFKKIIRGFTKSFGKLFGKGLGKAGGKAAAKKVPVLGLLLGLGFSVSRFKNGDVIGGLMEIASGVASTFPGPGTAISIGIDVLSAIRDIKGGGSEELGKSDANKWIKGAWDKVLQTIEKIPVINLLTNLPKAFAYMAEGNWGEAGKEIVKIFPGGGTLLNLLASSGAGFEAYKDTRARGGNFKDAMSSFFKTFSEKLGIGFIESLPEWMQGAAAKALGIEGYKEVLAKRDAAKKPKEVFKGAGSLSGAQLKRIRESRAKVEEQEKFQKDVKTAIAGGKISNELFSSLLTKLIKTSSNAFPDDVLGLLNDEQFEKYVRHRQSLIPKSMRMKSQRARTIEQASKMRRDGASLNLMGKKMGIKSNRLDGTRKGDKYIINGQEVPEKFIPDYMKKNIKGASQMEKAMQGAGLEDFVWRPGEEPRKFSSGDTLIGAKEGISLKEGKDIHLGIQQLGTVMGEIKDGINSLVGLTNDSVQQAAQPKQEGSGLDSIPAGAGYSRDAASDKAYGFRTRAWEILHGVT